MRGTTTRKRRLPPCSLGLPDGIGGTIAGGLMPAIDLGFLTRRGPGVSLGGAVSGAAQVVASSSGARGGQELGVSLTDGSRIIFSSLESPRKLMEA